MNSPVYFGSAVLEISISNQRGRSNYFLIIRALSYATRSAIVMLLGSVVLAGKFFRWSRSGVLKYSRPFNSKYQRPNVLTFIRTSFGFFIVRLCFNMPKFRKRALNC